jgi:hypothetical protein
MNRANQISFYKRQIESAKELKAVSMQNYNIAAQLESEAKSALDLLGANSERTRKGKQLSQEEQIKLRASLIK